MIGPLRPLLGRWAGYGTLDLGAFEEGKEQRLAALLLHCSAKVPYYRPLLGSSGVVLDRKVDLAAFSRLPLLDKATIRENLAPLTAEDHASRGSRWNTTGGSTGKPLKFLQDREYSRLSKAVTYDQQTWTGYRFGDPFVRLWGDARQALEGSPSLGNRLSRWARNLTFLDSFSMTRERMKDHIAVLGRVKPKLVIAYAQSIFELCGFAEKEGLRIEGVGAVMTSAGTLFPPMRERIERVCGCRVFDRYASREVSSIAGECEKGGLHVSPGILVEVLDEQGVPCPPGTEGEVVLTNLFNLSMPLLRYRIEDRGSLAEGPCPCGRVSQRMASVRGRITDSFRLRDGGRVFPGIFNHFFFHQDWVDSYQIVQKDYEVLEIRVAVIGEPLRDGIAHMEEGVRAAMGKDCEIRWVFTDRIVPSASGKHRYHICEIPGS